jgi:acetyl-CoA carboxylase carboxyltransferase component
LRAATVFALRGYPLVDGRDNDRIESLLDPGTAAAFDLPHERPTGALEILAGRLCGHNVVIAAIDQEAKRGAIGITEARALAALFDALTDSRPLVLLLDSSGARIDLGLEMLAAFRSLLASALRARRRGLPYIAVARSHCYGGASMLAYLAQRRILSADSRIAMSGPHVIAAMAGRSELDPDDAEQVEALLGGAARAKLVDGDRLCEDGQQALRAALAAWLDQRPAAADSSIAAKHRALFERLARHGIELPRSPKPSPPELKRRMDALLPEGFETVIGSGVVRGVRLERGREITITGIVGAAPLTAVASWMLAESIITSVRTRPERPIVILYDSPGHATTAADEAVLLSDYLVHLAQTVQWAVEQGVTVSVWILGEASGGGYVTLTAAAVRVLALAGASLRVLPRTAIESVVSDARVEESGLERWLQLGLIDEALHADVLTEHAAKAVGLPAG